MLNASFAMAVLYIISLYILQNLSLGYPDILNIPHSAVAFLLSYSVLWNGCLKFLITLTYPHLFPLHLNFHLPLDYKPSPVPFLPYAVSQVHMHISQCDLPVLYINPLKPELNPICYLLALLGAHYFLHFSRIRVKLLTFRRLMSYIYGAPILDVSRSHTTTQHSR